MKVRFYFDYKSPFSFLAIRNCRSLENEFNITVEWLPYAFNVNNGFGLPEHRTDYQKKKIKYIYQDVRRFADKHKLWILGPQRVFDSTIANISALWVQKHSRKAFDDYTDKVYILFFSRKLELDNLTQIQEVIENIGVTTGVEYLAFLEKDGKQIYENIENEANTKGVFGVPTWAFDDGTILFGQDRVQFIEEKLVAAGLAKPMYFENKIALLREQIKQLDDLKAKL